MDVIDGPDLVYREPSATLGIRVTTPFRGMLSVRDRLLEELFAWLDRREVREWGDSYLRLHVIDMAGPMDIEVGVTTGRRELGDDRVRPGLLPEGRYATLTYRDHSRRANKTLLDWVAAQGHSVDRRDEPQGDAFACRYELYVTDPRAEPRKTQWIIQLNMKLA